jgi:protein-S-isoprenylcysteine O-methyltransferase Ste14
LTPRGAVWRRRVSGANKPPLLRWTSCSSAPPLRRPAPSVTKPSPQSWSRNREGCRITQERSVAEAVAGPTAGRTGKAIVGEMRGFCAEHGRWWRCWQPLSVLGAGVLRSTVTRCVCGDDADVARIRAAVGSLFFLAIAPGVVAGLVPWLMTRWSAHAWFLPVRLLGAVLIAAGVAALLPAFVRFAVEGVGTPAPVAPTEQLVVGGAYRYVRNPMYLAVAAVIVGQALLLGRAILLLYALTFGASVTAFVRGYEEPTLANRFGEEYNAYRHQVPRWVPRLTPWRGTLP